MRLASLFAAVLLALLVGPPAISADTAACNLTVDLSDTDPAGTNVRSAPGGAVVAALKNPGDGWIEVHLVAQEGDWYQIDRANLIDADHAADGPMQFRGKGFVHRSVVGVSGLQGGARIHADHDSNSAVIEVPAAGDDRVELLGCWGDFAKVRLQKRTGWRITFESPAVLSLSAETFADTGGAHPNGGFRTIVWDKKAARAVPIAELFAPDQLQPALQAVAAAADKAWTRTYTQRSGQLPGADADIAADGIGADPEKLKNYALTYAKGQTNANGIVLLYGAGQVWPHVLGDFRLSIPAAVFAKYLSPGWRGVFSPGRTVEPSN